MSASIAGISKYLGVGEVASFAEANPQFVEGKLSYLFIGGASLRLLQEKYAKGLDRKRIISDIDVLSISGKAYLGADSVSTLNLLLDEMPVEELSMEAVSLNGSSLYCASPALMAYSKTVFNGVPREKDYHDLLAISELAVDEVDLLNLYSKSSGTCRLAPESSTSLYCRILCEKSTDLAKKLHSTFQEYIGLDYELSKSSLGTRVVDDFLRKTSHSPYNTAHILRESRIFMQIIENLPEKDKCAAISRVLEFANESTLQKFCRTMNYSINKKLEHTPLEEKACAWQSMSARIEDYT
jgi:hypothetical protein